MLFTTVVHNVPKKSVYGYDIYQVVQAVAEELKHSVPHARHNAHYSTIGDANGKTFHVATVEIMNNRRRVVATALVMGEEPMVAHKNRNAFGQQIICRKCNGDEFFYVSRSLDYENLECSQCGATARSITETGASA